MNILSIGNSFSKDASRYLSQIARANGDKINSANLFISGCSLRRHYANMFTEEKAYGLQYNGQLTGFTVTLKEALFNREWDIVTLQQVSCEAINYETFQPYLNELIKYVKVACPKAKIYFHQTWAYEEGSSKLINELGYSSYTQMLDDIKNASKKVLDETGVDGIIPSGELFDELLKSGIEKVHRDTFHASLGIGRYALALLWYKYFTGNDINDNSFNDFDEEVTDNEIATAKKCVNKLLN